MSPEEAQLLRFENYFLGKMNASEREEFEHELRTNQELAQSYEIFKATIQAIKKESFLADAKEISLEERQASQKKRRRRTTRSSYLVGMAASLVILLIAAYWAGWFQSDDQLTFGQLYKPYPNVMQQRNMAQSKIDEAFVHYSQGEFADALADFRQITSPGDTVVFYSAICALSLDRPEEAINSLTPLVGKPSGLREQVNWYLALAYFRKEDRRQARKSLEVILPGEYKYEQARLLINGMNRSE